MNWNWNMSISPTFFFFAFRTIKNASAIEFKSEFCYTEPITKFWAPSIKPVYQYWKNVSRYDIFRPRIMMQYTRMPVLMRTPTSNTWVRYLLNACLELNDLSEDSSPIVGVDPTSCLCLTCSFTSLWTPTRKTWSIHYKINAFVASDQ